MKDVFCLKDLIHKNLSLKKKLSFNPSHYLFNNRLYLRIRKCFWASHTVLSPVPQPTSKALQVFIGVLVTVSIRLKSGLPISQGTFPVLHLSLKRSSSDISLSISGFKTFDRIHGHGKIVALTKVTPFSEKYNAEFKAVSKIRLIKALFRIIQYRWGKRFFIAIR